MNIKVPTMTLSFSIHTYENNINKVNDKVPKLQEI